MSTFRKAKNKQNPFVMVDKVWINNPNLSAKAKGILLYLLSKPDDWIVYESDITNHMRDGLKSIKAGIKELMDQHHLHRMKVRDSSGRFRGYDYTVYENPCATTQSTEVPFSDNGERHTTNNDLTNRLNSNQFYDYDEDIMFDHPEWNRRLFQMWLDDRSKEN